jgi:uncharacterized protein
VGFAEGVMKIGDLQAGMSLSGVVTNVTAFGAFVDVGVHQDGLVHVSELADGFVKDPHAVVKVNQRVKVRVLAVDLERNRISLSMRQQGGRPEEKREKKPQEKRQAAGPGPQKKPKPGPFNNPFANAFRK